ncbi:MAG: SDR family NAD(P)-dependent oxidoreductase [Pelagibacteraceae bacterium]|jgi:short-subunit dehydrogenase
MNVLIIGGTFGIGYELSKKYLGKVQNLIILGRSEERFNQINEELKSPETKVYTKKLDVTSISETSRVLSQVINDTKKIDLVIYSSGFYKPNNTFDVDLDLYRKTIEVNFLGLINVMSIILPLFKKQQSGHVAMISSLAGFFGLPNSSGYGPSKAAMMNYSESIYNDCKKNNIDVSIINPGFVKTRLTDQNKFEMPFLMSAEKAADIIYKGLKKKKYDITFPFMMSLIFKTLKILPKPIFLFLIKYMVKTNN